MIALLQRVSEARVDIECETAGFIQAGLLAFIGVERGDDQTVADRLLERVLSYRMFDDDGAKMNCSVREIRGGLLFVPQFTLAADTNKGTRASFTSAAAPNLARPLFDYLVRRALQVHAPVASGIFGANMQVTLTNTGPVTFWIQVTPKNQSKPKSNKTRINTEG